MISGDLVVMKMNYTFPTSIDHWTWQRLKEKMTFLIISSKSIEGFGHEDYNELTILSDGQIRIICVNNNKSWRKNDIFDLLSGADET